MKFNVGETVINLEDGTLVKIVAASYAYEATDQQLLGEEYCIRYIWGELKVVPELFLARGEKKSER